MRYKIREIVLVIAACALSACGGGGGGSYSPPSGGGGGGPTGPQSLPPQTIGLSLPSGLIGVENDPTFGAVGGYTQTVYSQTLAFQTGTTVTIQNLGGVPHTLNVLSTTAFPANGPTTTAASGTTLGTGFATGPINPGATVTAMLGAIGTYFLGCAFHYANAPGGMRTALIVTGTANPQPGPQATPGPATTGGTPGCHGFYC